MSQRQRVLIVDDEKFNRQLLSDLLLEEYDVSLAKDGEQALLCARNVEPDLILLDVVMPGMDGYEVLRQLRTDERTAGIPVIFVTGMSDEADETRGLAMGAVDYVLKPFRSAVVRARVRNHMNYVWQRKQLERDAFVDALTRIPNRRKFDQILDAEWKRACRLGKPLSLAMVDVDYFKPYNDAYGHGAGDTVLRRIAEEMRAALNRSCEFVARYGGEEFALLLPEVSRKEAMHAAERVRAVVETLKLPHGQSDISPVVTISVGGITMLPSLDTSTETMLELADKQLYLAKRSGRNRTSWVAGHSSDSSLKGLTFDLSENIII